MVRNAGEMRGVICNYCPIECLMHVQLATLAFVAADVTLQAAIMAATQRPVAELAFSEPSGIPAWKTLPSWAVVATGDKAAGSDVIRSMARRAGATITEVEGSHVMVKTS
jgi:hypothetical protein